jgi:phosphoribosylaminoimidazole carboxylase (NCAIR synthetase)
MRLLILGGGSGQLSLIKKAKDLGYEVVVSDYYPDALGKKIADFSSESSTFDFESNLETAKKFKVAGVLTAGTDQPVYTAARVAAELNLNHPLSVETAKAVTNKRVMKNKYSQSEIPTVKYKIVDSEFSEQELELMTKVSILYYKKELNQSQIASELGISRLKVSRLIKKARAVLAALKSSLINILVTDLSMAEFLQNQKGVE